MPSTTRRSPWTGWADSLTGTATKPVVWTVPPSAGCQDGPAVVNGIAVAVPAPDGAVQSASCHQIALTLQRSRHARSTSVHPLNADRYEIDSGPTVSSYRSPDLFDHKRALAVRITDRISSTGFPSALNPRPLARIFREMLRAAVCR